MKVLVIAVLSQATSDLNCFRAFQALQQAFPSWEQLLEASDEELAAVIRPGGLAKNKAPRIRQIIKQVQADFGELSLAQLKNISREEGYRYLTGLPGVGFKTAGCVWAFGCDKPALPVDTHVGRVLFRLGHFDHQDPNKMQLALENEVPPEIQRDMHILLIEFGRQICRKGNPRCDRCPFAQECQYYVRGESD